MSRTRFLCDAFEGLEFPFIGDGADLATSASYHQIGGPFGTDLPKDPPIPPDFPRYYCG